MKTTCAGGSSIDLSSALNDGGRELVDFVDDEDLVAVADRRDRQPGDHHLADVVDAGVAGRVDLEHVDVAPLRDLDARVALAARLGASAPSRSSAPCARMRAVVVLPQPRGPANTNACAMRPLAMALRSVRVTGCWPTTSSNRCGRHLRARTW